MLFSLIKRLLLILLLFFSLFANDFATTRYPTNQTLYDVYPYAFTYYYGISGKDALAPMVMNLKFHRWPEHIQSAEIEKTLLETNFLRRFFNPVVGVVQVAINTTIRKGSDQRPVIYELDPYLTFRWANLPWNAFITTSFAIGEGLSYVSAIPALERSKDETNRKLLNYLMLEVTFAAPSYPRLQLIARIHHRSGCYGLYRAGNTGSNAVGLGLRYLF